MGWPREETEIVIDTNNIHIKWLVKLRNKCQKVIETDAQARADKWYQYSLEDMVEDKKLPI